MNENANMAQRYEHEIPEGYEARIEGGKVIIELKESEDERIRKNILSLVKKHAVNHERCQMEDYLEKQKEQPTNEEMLRILRAEYEKGVADTIAKYEQIPIFRVGDNIIAKDETCIPKQPFHIERIEDDCYWDGNNSILVCNQDDFQLIEQRPAEWSEDERIRKELIFFLKEEIPQCSIKEHADKLKEFVSYLEKQKKQKLAERVEINKSLSDAVITELSKYNGENYWKSPWAIDSTGLQYPLYFANLGATWQREQRPAEWSEVDKSILNNIVAYKVLNIDDLEWLKSLPERFNLQPKQEWSEEDCKIIESINMVFDACAEKNIASEKTTLHKLRAWLKSLHERVSLQSKAEWSKDYCDEDLRTRFAFYTYKDEDDVLYLSNVFVEETSRNKGFGAKILAAAEKVAETIGAINIRLKVKRDSPANVWYRKHGYEFIAFEEDYDWLEKALEYQNPNKQEWSEEDKNNFNRIAAILVEGSYAHPWWSKESLLSKDEMQKLTDWFKSLLPPIKDRDMKLKILKYLSTRCSSLEFEEVENYLNNLHPSWKPSEEQIGALNYAYCELFKRKDAGHNILSPLQKLIDDLQKLL